MSFKSWFGALEDAGFWHLDLDLDIVTVLLYTYDPNFSSLSWFWRCKEHWCPLSPDLGLWRMLEVPDWGLASWLWFGYWSLVSDTPKLKIFALYLEFEGAKRLAFRRMLEVPDWGLASWSWFFYGHWSLVHQWSKFRLSILIFKVKKTSMSFKSWFGALKDAGGSCLGFGILITIWYGHWSLTHPWSKS